MAPVFAMRVSASCWVSHVMLCRHFRYLGQSKKFPRVPRSGFEHEWQRDALQGRSTRSQDKLSVDALRELALHAGLFAGGARRARRQALELPVQRLRFLTVLERERSRGGTALVTAIVHAHGAGRDRRDQRGRDGERDL